MVSKVCEQSKMITQLTAALQAKDAKIIEQYDQLKQATKELAATKEKLAALQGWQDMTISNQMYGAKKKSTASVPVAPPASS